MNYKIVSKESFRIVGYATREPMTMEDCFEKIPKFWQSVKERGGIGELQKLMDGNEPAGILGVSLCEGGDYSGFLIAAATSAPVPEGMEEQIIPATTYAVFECTGPLPDAMQTVQQRIISEWLPTSGYEYAPAPDIEVYGDGDQSSENYHSEVWLPIIKK